MPAPRTRTRRDVLIGLAALAPLAHLAGAASAQVGDADPFLSVSRTITGDASLSPEVAARVEALLADRVDGFADRLARLAEAMRGAGITREEVLGGLSDDQVEFALQVAKPWYLGYVGSPSSTILEDDAAFATYLQAQAWEKIVDQVPRPTYPGRAAGWWDAPPPGVDAPDMPDRIGDWTFHPGGPGGIVPPDARWRRYATADHGGVEAARRAKPDAGARAGADPDSVEGDE